MKRAAGVVFSFLVTFVLPSFGGGDTARDLGEGLVYLRCLAESEPVGGDERGSLGGDSGTSRGDDGEFALPAAFSGELSEQAALVLDLRYTDAWGAREAQQLGLWLTQRADALPETPPVFFLVNAQTSLALWEAVAQFAQNYPALVVGPASDGDLSPDIAVAVDAAEERAAYAALASGEVELSDLVGEGAVADKRRYDEAAVIAAHAAPSRAERRPPRAESTEDPPKDTVVRPVDLALQRAIHLHRAWRVFAHP